MTPAEIQESPFRKDIDIIIDECASWFAQIVRAVFYPLQMSKKPVAKLEYESQPRLKGSCTLKLG